MIERARLQTLRRSLIETHAALSPAGFVRALDALIESARVVGRDGERDRILTGLAVLVRDAEPETKEAA